jgi:hypothetical protein
MFHFLMILSGTRTLVYMTDQLGTGAVASAMHM